MISWFALSTLRGTDYSHLQGKPAPRKPILKFRDLRHYPTGFGSDNINSTTSGLGTSSHDNAPWASQETTDSGSSSDGTGSQQADADSDRDVQWLDGDNSVVEDDIDFITCARDLRCRGGCGSCCFKATRPVVRQAYRGFAQ